MRSGAKSQLSGIVTAILAVLVAIFLAPLLDDLPSAVLAAMVMVAIVSLLNPADLFRYARIDRAEFWVAVVVAALGLTGGMLLGVAAGVALTLALVVRNLNHPRIRPLYPRTGGGWTTVEPTSIDRTTYPGALLLHLDGALYTGNAQATLDDVVRRAQEAGPEVHAVVLEGSAVHVVSVTMIDTFRSMQEELLTEGFTLILTGFPPETLEVMRRSRWFVEAEGRGLTQPTVDAAIEAAAADQA